MGSALSRRDLLLISSAAAATVVVGATPSAGAGLKVPHPRHTIAEPLLALTASDAVKAMRRGRLTAERYVTALLDHAEQLTDLRAVITLDRPGAVAAARRVDASRRAGRRLGPVAGLPILVKDNINTRNLPTTGGTPALRDLHPDRDAVVLQALLRAGAIVLGKANMHEMAFGITNTNFSPFAGFAQNPYDRTRIPGGSSGGTAAAIAARIVPAGLGSDTGGSVRIPASFNGIAGLRPSTGNGGAQRRYSTDGVLPLSRTLDTVGPLGRTVADVALLDSAVTGTARTTPVKLRKLRLAIPAVLWDGLESQVSAVAESAKERLADAGVELVDVDMPDLLDLADKITFPLALHEPIEEITRYLQETGATGITLQSIAEQIASPDVRAAFSAVITDAQGGAYPDAMNIYRPRIQRLIADYYAANRVDAILFPTSPVLPALIDPINGTGTISIDGGPQVDTFTTTIRNQTPASTVGMPGLSLPVGLSASGLPVGLELDGPIGSDRRLLSIGIAIEQLFGSLPAPTL